MELQALPSRIGQVRRIVSAQLRYWHLDSLTDRAMLGVTELLSNVHRHARLDKTCTVEIELGLDRLTVSVRDHDPRLPQAGDAQPLATCGRGLAMVAAVSESWGVRPEGDSGKVVWFTLTTSVPGAASAPSVAMPTPTSTAAGAGCSPAYGGEGASPVVVGGESGGPDVVPGPFADLVPVLEPALESGLEPACEPACRPEFEPVLEPALAPDFEPALESALESAVEPVLQPGIEPVPDAGGPRQAPARSAVAG